MMERKKSNIWQPDMKNNQGSLSEGRQHLNNGYEEVSTFISIEYIKIENV